MDLNTFKEYIRLHAISMEQDLDNIDGADYSLPYIEGAIAVSKHYLEVVSE
jgi:hypothetical protein